MKEKIKRQAKDHSTTETLIYQNCVDGTCQKNTYIRPNIVVYSKNEATVYILHVEYISPRWCGRWYISPCYAQHIKVS